MQEVGSIWCLSYSCFGLVAVTTHPLAVGCFVVRTSFGQRVARMTSASGWFLWTRALKVVGGRTVKDY